MTGLVVSGITLTRMCSGGSSAIIYLCGGLADPFGISDVVNVCA